MKPQQRSEIRADLDPNTTRWIALGGFFGILMWACALPTWMPAHELLHERGVVQVFTMGFGGMVAGFIYFKGALIFQEKRNTLRLLPNPSNGLSEKIINTAKPTLVAGKGILAARSAQALQLYQDHHSIEKIERRIESDTEAYDLAHQSSYSLPRILVWAIPVLGFIGTVIGIGDAVSGFQGFLSKVDDVDVLREGLVKVTTGLGTAFDTTFLALVISLVVMLPLAYLERQEQHLLTLIDLRLRSTVFDNLPETQESSGVKEAAVERIVSDAFKKNLPSAEALVEPAKLYAELSAQRLVDFLKPLGELVVDTHLQISNTRESTVSSVERLCQEIDTSTRHLSDSIERILPQVQIIARIPGISNELTKQLESLEASSDLRTTLLQLQESLGLLRGSLAEAARPRRVVLMEER